VLIVGGDLSLEAESLDRTSLLLPGQQQQLVSQVAKAARGPVILVIMSGGPFDISFAKDDDKISGILWVGYPGEAGGAAIADVIFGAYNPGGRLPVTWYPQEFAVNVNMTNMTMRADPATGYPGRTYRFYTGQTVFAFGDGLSYTSFNITVVHAPKLISIPLAGKNTCFPTQSKSCEAVSVTSTKCEDLSVQFQVEVKNVGNRDGSQVLFLFATNPSNNPDAPKKQLIGFNKVHVKAGATERVLFTLEVCKDLSIVDKTGARLLPLGSRLLYIGDLQHSVSLQISS
jgi:beta-D-xylosidase 4